MLPPPDAIEQDPATDPNNQDHMKVGTLTYTKAGLIGLFTFLLWGDFCWCLMESVTPSVLTLRFATLQVPNWILGLILTTIPKMVEIVVNPVFSFWSDRFRSRWGRRIPFLMGCTPFLVVFLILIGYSDPISQWVHRAILGGKYSDTTVLVWIIGIFMVGFQFFNAFTNSIYYYLFNDVVPHAFLARFLSLFRMASQLAGICYSFFVIRYADTHMKEIFLGGAIIYFIGFTMMCFKVKEGEYPPPPAYVGNDRGILGGIKTYFAESFSLRFYWLLFTADALQGLAWVGGGFSLLLATKYLHLSLAFIGNLGAACGIFTLFLNYPSGVLADRFHPLRVVIIVNLIGLLLTPLMLWYVFIAHPQIGAQSDERWWIVLNGIGLPLAAIDGACGVPMLMKLFPQERFGQFCSANALVRAIAMMLGGVGCGFFLDSFKRLNPNPDYCFRFLPYWTFATTFGFVFFLLLVYREWQRLGGLKSYEPPRAGNLLEGATATVTKVEVPA